MGAVRRFNTFLVFALVLCGCTHAQLRTSGDAMIRVERGTEGIVSGVIVFKDVTKAVCTEKDLPTPEERRECVSKALAALTVSEKGVQAVKESLVAYWTLYPMLEAKFDRGERPTPAELAELARLAASVSSAFQALVQAVDEAKK